MKRKTLAFVIALAALFALVTQLQAKRGSPPKSFSLPVLALGQIEHREMGQVDIEALLREDAMLAGKPGTPYRIAYPVSLRTSLNNSGTLERLDDGGVLWRLRVTSRGALFLSFTFADFFLPPGSELRFISLERDFFDGPYTDRNNNPDRVFGSPIIPGDSAVIELYLPAGAQAEASLDLESVSHGYRNFRNVASAPFRDGSLPAVRPRAAVPLANGCEVDINCPEGDLWQDDKRAVAEIFDGTFVCTGTLLNNVREDCRNYFLTANHCVKSSGKASKLVFFWNYENTGCNTGDATFDQTSVGSFFRAGYNQSDFTLVELFDAPDPSYFVYHAGWNNSAAPASSAVTIHHPNDLPKKISFEFDPLVDGQQDGWGDDHWRVTDWDIGTTEPGSSGSGLWNPNHQVVGQLHGGIGDCDGGWDEYGKLSVSWLNGLSDFLDPDSSGAVAVNGKNCTGEPPPPEPCELGGTGDACTADSQCCSGKCRGKAGSQTCR